MMVQKEIQEQIGTGMGVAIFPFRGFRAAQLAESSSQATAPSSAQSDNMWFRIVVVGRAETVIASSRWLKLSATAGMRILYGPRDGIALGIAAVGPMGPLPRDRVPFSPKACFGKRSSFAAEPEWSVRYGLTKGTTQSVCWHSHAESDWSYTGMEFIHSEYRVFVGPAPAKHNSTCKSHAL